MGLLKLLWGRRAEGCPDIMGGGVLKIWGGGPKGLVMGGGPVVLGHRGSLGDRRGLESGPMGLGGGSHSLGMKGRGGGKSQGAAIGS